MGLTSTAAQSGRLFLEVSRNTGGAFLLFFQVLKRLVSMEMDGLEFKRCLLRMGYRSVSIIMSTAVVVGIILVIQAFVFVDRYGLRSQLGWGAGFVTIRELGPMTVTDQVNGLRCLALDPIAYLVVPRFLAMIISLAALTVIGNTTALLSASVVGDLMMEVDQHTFWSSLTTMLTPWDYITSVVKAGFFGGIIAVTSCYFGLNATGGAPGVGRAVNTSVVASASAVFVIDFFSTFVLG
jgi:phospholipid/cholesterol/gamma-HCH transport system permease protein